MNKETCPHCGSENYQDGARRSRKKDCYERQLAAAFEEIEQLKIASQELNDVIHQIKTILQILKVK